MRTPGELDWIMAYVEERTERGNTSFGTSMIRAAQADLARLRPLWPALATLDVATRAWPVRRTASHHVCFLGDRFLHLARQLRSSLDVTVLSQSLSNSIEARRHGLASSTLYSVRRHTALATIAGDAHRRDRHLRDAVDSALRSLERIATGAVIVWNDSLPFDRVVMEAARRLEVPVVCIQDGIFLPSSHADDLHGYESNAMLLWGEFFSELYNMRRSPDLHVLGYPHPPRRVPRSPVQNSKTPTVCFVGQPWEAYDSSLEAPKLDILRAAVHAAEREGFATVYRPHPGESEAALGNASRCVRLAPRGETLDSAFEAYDVFVGITSTVLIEAEIAGRPAVQLRHEAFGDDDFEAYGATRSVPGLDIDRIAGVLRSVTSAGGRVPTYPSSDFVRILPEPGSVFSRWLRDFLD